MLRKTIAKVTREAPLVIKPISDLFTVVLWFTPKNEPILRDFLNAVLDAISWPFITRATVRNRFTTQEFAVDPAIVLDVRAEEENQRHFNIEVPIASHLWLFRIGGYMTGRNGIPVHCE